MVPIEEAQRIITAHVGPLGTDIIDTRHADGRVLSTDLVSHEDMPDVPKAAVDGYALIASDATAPRQVLAEVVAGSNAQVVVTPGSAVRIMTGAPVPPGADAVIMVEQTDEQHGVMQVQRAVRTGDNIHTVGQDIQNGALILAHGTPIGSAATALLATLGHMQIAVYQQPRVAVISTGDEVYEPDAPQRTGGIRDSNRYALLAAIREAGCIAVSLGIARDDLTVQRTAILAAADQADVLLTSGGVSMGTRDLIKPLLAELGTVHFGRIAFKPGKPTTFATIERPGRQPLLVFGLPGYPVSSLVSFEVFVRPALRRMLGDAHPERPTATVVLRDPIRPSFDRPEYQRAIVHIEDGRLVARSTGAQGSSRLLSLRGANALIHVPAGEQVFPAGATLQALLTGPLE
jgi:molybdopterin molybdotransferase